MIESWIALPIGLRLILLSALGAVIGAAANHVIYRYAWFSRLIGPWGQPHPEATGRTRGDRIPIVGWWLMRRESNLHGRGFWIRPMMIEIAMVVSVPALYWFETQSGRLLPANVPRGEIWLTKLFIAHLTMLAFMVAATFIDFDEQTIPDLLTVPGTLAALLLATLSLQIYMPGTDSDGVVQPTAFYLPLSLDPKWLGRTGLWTALAIWTGWCFALSNRRIILRRGPAKAVEYFFAYLVRDPSWKFLLAMWIAGFVVIRVVFGIGGERWIGLLTGLVGLGVGGGIVWAIRIVGAIAMRREAMGFGDVTLMAMIGTFIGWQGAVMSFFLSPIAAIAIVLIYFIITRNSEIPFGPYLCAGTLLTLFGWDRLVDGWFLRNLATLGPFMLWLFIAVAGMMGVLLFFVRLAKESLLGDQS